MGVSKRLYERRMLGSRRPEPIESSRGGQVAPRPTPTPPPPTGDPDRPAVGFPIRRFGVSVEDLDRSLETGEPATRCRAAWVAVRRIALPDGTAEYWLRDRRGGRVSVRTEPAAPEPEPEPAEPEPLEFVRTFAAADFLEAAFSLSARLGEPAIFDGREVEIIGDSRPPGGRVSWFLKRREDGRRLVVRLEKLGVEVVRPDRPDPPIPSPAPPPRRRGKKRRDDQAVFDFASGAESSGPYSQGG